MALKGYVIECDNPYCKKEFFANHYIWGKDTSKTYCKKCTKAILKKYSSMYADPKGRQILINAINAGTIDYEGLVPVNLEGKDGL